MTLLELNLAAIWVDPKQSVATAKFILEGYGVRALGAIEFDQLIGIVDREQLKMASPEQPVREIMQRNFYRFNATENVREAAAVMAAQKLEYVPVVLGDEFQGFVTALDLLTILGKSYDPMTELPWSDELRSWGHEKLSAGQEISVIFIDLDDFGLFNKNYGHVIGDRVLRVVADYLKSRCRPGREVLVRYGGDEFAIGTTLSRDETEAFAQSLRSNGLEVEGAHPVRFSVGVFGGRRAKARSKTHAASMMDDLVSNASKAALLQKKLNRGATEIAPKLDSIRVVSTRTVDGYSVVTLLHTERKQIYVGSAKLEGTRPEEAVLHACLDALHKAGIGGNITVDSLAVVSVDNQSVVSMKGVYEQGLIQRRLNIHFRSESDPLLATAESTVSAVLQRA